MKIFIQAASCSLGLPSTFSVDLICAPPCQSPLLQLLALLRVFPATSQLPKRETRTFRIFVCTTIVSCSTAVPALSSCCRRCATDVDLLGITNRYTNNSIRAGCIQVLVSISFVLQFPLLLLVSPLQMYLSSPTWRSESCNSASIRRFHGIQLLNLSISIR